MLVKKEETQMKKIVILSLLIFCLSGCSDKSMQNNSDNTKESSSTTVQETKLDISNINVPESVIYLSSINPEICKSEDQLFVETATYYDSEKDVEKPVINILKNDENGDSMMAILTENGKVEKYIFRGDNLGDIFSVIDSMGDQASALSMIEDTSNALDNNETLEKEYSSDSYNYFLTFYPTASYPVKSFTVVIIPT